MSSHSARRAVTPSADPTFLIFTPGHLCIYITSLLNRGVEDTEFAQDFSQDDVLKEMGWTRDMLNSFAGTWKAFHPDFQVPCCWSMPSRMDLEEFPMFKGIENMPDPKDAGITYFQNFAVLTNRNYDPSSDNGGYVLCHTYFIRA